MKKLILIIIPLVLVSLLAAISLDFDGENRTRAAIYNNSSETNGGHIDNRLLLGMDADLTDNLMMRANIMFGDVTWGNGGGGLTSAVPMSAYELYVDYRLNCIESNIRIGQQYWASPMSLIIDDTFSGVMLTKDNFIGFKTELAYIKAVEGGLHMADDYDYYLLNLQGLNPLPFGLLASYGHDGLRKYDTATIMPYINMDLSLLEVKASVWASSHFNPPFPFDNGLGFGFAVKAKADLGILNVGADILAATENSLTALSPYYQNGLYIFGYGRHHDGLNLYWSDPYSANANPALSLVGNVNLPLSSKCNIFGTAGYLMDKGIEVNCGFEHDIIPDLMQLTGYAAYGLHDSSFKSSNVNNYVLGTTLKVTF